MGPYPPADYYNADAMSKDKRQAFLIFTWYEDKVNSGAIFDFQKELLKYCESDVNLLKEGCLSFLQEIKQEASFDTLIDAVTIASACNLYWRREKLEEDVIALEP